MTLAELADAVRFHGLPWSTGKAVDLESGGVSPSLPDGDVRFARSLGLDKKQAAGAMAQAWGKTFVQQRNSLAGADATPQRKGQVSRALKAELQAALGTHR